MDTKLWKKILPKMKLKQLLPKDIELFERLEKEDGQVAMENFEKLLDLAVRTPPFKLKSSRVSRKRSDKVKNQT